MFLTVHSTRPGNSRTVSDSDIPHKPTSPVTPGLSVPSRPPNTRQTSYNNRRSGAVTPQGIPTGIGIPGAQVTELLAGITLKSFYAHTDLLKSRSSYFRELFSLEPPTTCPPPLKYAELDEFAMALFIRWLYGAVLQGPSDSMSMQHYMALYVLALKFRIERLCNEVMDLVRKYYRTANMTAPGYRLEYIYSHTDEPNQMRRFMTDTAAYRALCEGSINESMKDVLGRIPELSADFATALIECHKSALTDCRRGQDCAWHVHNETNKCKSRVTEPWQNI